MYTTDKDIEQNIKTNTYTYIYLKKLHNIYINKHTHTREHEKIFTFINLFINPCIDSIL